MENKFHDLPPLKRYRLIHQQEEQDLKSLPSSPCLPAKKRKESRTDSPPFPPKSSTTTTTTTYCLPAKKRIWAFSPFDLNVEYNPSLDEEEKEILKPKNAPNTNSISNTSTQIVENEEDDDGIVCAVCQSTDGDPSDPIVFCDGCDLMVHTTCYGHPLTNGVPEGDWFCCQCSISKSPKTHKKKAQSCCLCPAIGGAMKPTGDGRWAHIVCALFVPEVFFKDPEGREGIDCSKVPARRWEQSCYVCESANGCAIDCSEPKCPLGFHVTCGLKEELCIEYREGKNNGAIVVGFCKSHTNLWNKVFFIIILIWFCIQIFALFF